MFNQGIDTENYVIVILSKYDIMFIEHYIDYHDTRGVKTHPCHEPIHNNNDDQSLLHNKISGDRFSKNNV